MGESTTPIPLPDWVDREAARRRDEMRNPFTGLSHDEVSRRIEGRNGQDDLMMLRFFVLALALLTTAYLPAVERAAEPTTLLSIRGKLLLADDFNKPLGAMWRTGKGKWEIVEDSLRGAELEADKHEASARHPFPFRDVVIQCSFKFDGAREASLKLNSATAHCCRFVVAPKAFTLQHYVNDVDKPTWKTLQSREIAARPGDWHTVVWEIRGREVVGSLDGTTVVFGEHDSIDVDRTTLILNIAGSSASFRDLRVWERLANEDWKATNRKLILGGNQPSP